MKLISNRGNITLAQKEYENRPSYIETAINLGYDVKIDVCIKDKKLFLGADEPQYKLDIDWLKKYNSKLWLQCKSIEVIQKFNELDHSGSHLNYFWHENDTMTLTSKCYIWGKEAIKGGICISPELNNIDIKTCYGVCSDIIDNYKKI